MKPYTVLIADDDASLCRVLTVRCQHIGLKVLTAHDAMHALTVVHKQTPDLVVMDISMPAGNGLSACEMLASDQRLSKIPVIIMSGLSNQETVERCRDLGARFILKRPDMWAAMRQHICDLLQLTDVPEDAAAA